MVLGRWRKAWFLTVLPILVWAAPSEDWQKAQQLYAAGDLRESFKWASKSLLQKQDEVEPIRKLELLEDITYRDADALVQNLIDAYEVVSRLDIDRYSRKHIDARKSWLSKFLSKNIKSTESQTWPRCRDFEKYYLNPSDELPPYHQLRAAAYSCVLETSRAPVLRAMKDKLDPDWAYFNALSKHLVFPGTEKEDYAAFLRVSPKDKRAATMLTDLEKIIRERYRQAGKPQALPADEELFLKELRALLKASG